MGYAQNRIDIRGDVQDQGRERQRLRTSHCLRLSVMQHDVVSQKPRANRQQAVSPLIAPGNSAKAAVSASPAAFRCGRQGADGQAVGHHTATAGEM